MSTNLLRHKKSKVPFLSVFSPIRLYYYYFLFFSFFQSSSITLSRKKFPTDLNDNTNWSALSYSKFQGKIGRIMKRQVNEQHKTVYAKSIFICLNLPTKIYKYFIFLELCLFYLENLSLSILYVLCQ